MPDEQDAAVWERTYSTEPVESLPWFYADFDPDFEEALRRLDLHAAKVLDIGTGPGIQAIALAERGFQVTGTDVSPTILERARAQAAQKGLDITFQEDDILASNLDAVFDLVVDRGCFHVLAPDQRTTYVEAVSKLLRPGGYLFLKCFRRPRPLLLRLLRGNGRPYHFSSAEVEQLFRGSFRVCSIEKTLFPASRKPFPRALFCVFQKS